MTLTVPSHQQCLPLRMNTVLIQIRDRYTHANNRHRRLARKGTKAPDTNQVILYVRTNGYHNIQNTKPRTYVAQPCNASHLIQTPSANALI